MYLLAQAILSMNVLDRDLKKIGTVYDIYFDDISFAVRYLVIETGTVFDRQRTLISPETVTFISVERDELAINLTVEQVRESVDIDEMPTVSRQWEKTMTENFGWAPYWEYPMFPISNAFGSGLLTPGQNERPQSKYMETRWVEKVEPNLRSFQEVRGYRIRTADKHWGYLEDLVIRSTTWVVSYFSVEHYRWLPGRRVIMDTAWITDVNWEKHGIQVDLPSDAFEAAPRPRVGHGVITDDQLADVIDYQQALEARQSAPADDSPMRTTG